jgi:hypothetical protein
MLSTNATGSLAWSNNGGTTSTFTVTSAGNYSVTATNLDGCSATSSVTAVTVNAYPVLAGITGNTTVTIGSTTQLSNTTPGGVWSSSANATVNASGLVTGVNAGSATISYTFTSGAGCGTTVTTTVTVTALPTCTTPVINALSNISVNSTSTLCGAPVTYATTVSGTPTPAMTYTFTGATTGNGNGTGSGSIFNVGVTTVVITAANSCGSVVRIFTVTVTDATVPIALAKNITVALGCKRTGYCYSFTG